MNNSNEIKLINENGVEKTYGQIPDLWHIAMLINEGRDHGGTDRETCEKLAEDILHVWHMAHDLKAVIESQGKAALVDSDEQIERAARQAERNERINRKCDDLIREALPPGFTYGYIGNIWQDGTDDRSWHIHRPVTGRAKTRDDQVGPAYCTSDRRQLLNIAEAIRDGYDAAQLEAKDSRRARA